MREDRINVLGEEKSLVENSGPWRLDAADFQAFELVRWCSPFYIGGNSFAQVVIVMKVQVDADVQGTELWTTATNLA